jgi:hypothetical protein
MISEMLLEVVLISFSSVFFSSSLMRNEMTFCNCSVSFLFFLDNLGSRVMSFLVYDMLSSCGCAGQCCPAVSVG